MADNHKGQGIPERQSEEGVTSAPHEAAGQAGDGSRRAFLSRTTRKALYLTPVILSLAASQAKAASGASGTS